MTELYTDHMEIAEGLVHDRFVDLDSRGFQPEYQDVRAVASSSSDRAYVVAKTTALTKPKGHPDLDIVADKQPIYLCGCDDFYYHRSSGIETDADPESIDECKHITAEFKTIRAQSDDAQTEL